MGQRLLVSWELRRSWDAFNIAGLPQGLFEIPSPPRARLLSAQCCERFVSLDIWPPMENIFYLLKYLAHGRGAEPAGEGLHMVLASTPGRGPCRGVGPGRDPGLGAVLAEASSWVVLGAGHARPQRAAVRVDRGLDTCLPVGDCGQVGLLSE